MHWQSITCESRIFRSAAPSPSESCSPKLRARFGDAHFVFFQGAREIATFYLLPLQKWLVIHRVLAVSFLMAQGIKCHQIISFLSNDTILYFLYSWKDPRPPLKQILEFAGDLLVTITKNYPFTMRMIRNWNSLMTRKISFSRSVFWRRLKVKILVAHVVFMKSR